jgi:hypothetical protein
MLARQIVFGFGIAVVLPLLVYYAVTTFYSAPPKFRDFVSFEDRGSTEKRQAAEEAYARAAKNFARAHIVVAVPVGLAAILIGTYVAAHAIGAGLVLGGIATIVWGYHGYWQYLDDWIRFVSLLVTFVVLIVLARRSMPQGGANAGKS